MSIAYIIKSSTGFDIVNQLRKRATHEAVAVSNRLASMYREPRKHTNADLEKTKTELFIRQQEINFFDNLTIELVPDDPSKDTVSDDSIGAGYQVMRGNRVVSVRDLTKQQLLEELVKAMDTIERFDGLGDRLIQIVKDWRDGKDIIDE